MSTTWSANRLRRYPELRWIDPADPIARREFAALSPGWWSALFTALVYPLMWTMIWVVATIAPGMVMQTVFAHSLELGGWLARFTAGLWALGMLAMPFIVLRSITARTSRHLRAELRRRSVPICVSCGYEGVDITADRCIECGAAHATP